jgi:hypothetical protein
MAHSKSKTEKVKKKPKTLGGDIDTDSNKVGKYPKSNDGENSEDYSEFMDNYDDEANMDLFGEEYPKEDDEDED